MEKTEEFNEAQKKINQDLDPETLQKMSKQMQNILAIRGDLSLRVAQRVTFLIRFNIIVFGVIVISLLLFMIIMPHYTYC